MGICIPWPIYSQPSSVSSAPTSVHSLFRSPEQKLQVTHSKFRVRSIRYWRLPDQYQQLLMGLAMAVLCRQHVWKQHPPGVTFSPHEARHQSCNDLAVLKTSRIDPAWCTACRSKHYFPPVCCQLPSSCRERTSYDPMWPKTEMIHQPWLRSIPSNRGPVHGDFIARQQPEGAAHVHGFAGLHRP